MASIHDQDGNEIADIPLSEMQLGKLFTGMTISVQFHTPRMLRGGAGGDAGTFSLHLVGDEIQTSDVEAVKRCAAILTLRKK